MYRGSARNNEQTDPEYAERQIHDFIEEKSSGFLVSDEAHIGPIFQYLQNRPGVRFDHLENSLVVKHAWETEITLLNDDKVEAKLPCKTPIEAALARGWAKSNYGRLEGLDSIVLDEMRNYTDPTSAETVTTIVNELGKNNRWHLNNNGEQLRLDFAIRKAKAAILQKVSRVPESGRGKWPEWSSSYGAVRWKDAALLDKMSVEELLAVIEKVSNLYKQMRGDRYEQRELLANFSDAMVGLGRRPRQGDLDSLSGAVRYKEEEEEGSGRNAFEFVPSENRSQAKPSGDPRMDRSTPAPASENIRILFIDPATNDYYKPDAIKKLFRTNTTLIRKMMSTDLAFTNYLLNAKN